MIGDVRLNTAIEAIGEADSIETAGLMICCLRRLGEHGRETARAILEQIKAEEGPDDITVEGLVQICDVEGVLDGRLESI